MQRRFMSFLRHYPAGGIPKYVDPCNHVHTTPEAAHVCCERRGVNKPRRLLVVRQAIGGFSVSLNPQQRQAIALYLRHGSRAYTWPNASGEGLAV